VFELRRRNMHDCVGDEFPFGSELHPFNPRRPTFRTDCSRWNHDVLAANAPDGH
jgi:hypothetical protein